ncbi:MAG: protein kinase [Gordonia sp. (in: high G+C Gram-positive bacteria)]
MLSAGQNFANYRIVRQLGAGGMGEVYLAAHPRLPREDALKVLPTELTDDPTYRARFTREADLAAQLDHPSIVSVYDRGEFNGQLWIAMKYIPGSDCDQLLHASGAMTSEAVIQIVSAVGDALDYAHEHGMLHRDVKPANILVDDSSTSRRKIYLTDFGIARTIDNDTALTAANLTVGSIQYSSPEQLRGEKLDGGTDQYALACTAFRLLTGRAPFPLPKPTDIISAHLSAPAPSVTAILPTLAPTVDTVIARAMEKDPARRYRMCADFASDLAGALTKPGFSPSRAEPGQRAAYAPTMISGTPIPPQPTSQPLPQSDPRNQVPPSSGQPNVGQPNLANPNPMPQGPAQQPQNPYAAPASGTPQAPPSPAATYGAPPSQGPPNQPPFNQPPFNQGPPNSGPYGFGPQQPYGAQPSPQPSSGGSGSKKVLIALGILALIAALAVGGTFLFRSIDKPKNASDSSVTTSASPSTGDTSAPTSPPSTSVGSDPQVVAGVPTACTVGTDTQGVSATTVAVPPISIPSDELPKSPGWVADDGRSRVPFAARASGVVAPRPNPDSSWMAQVTVGTLPSNFSGNTEATVRKFIECLQTNPGYAPSSPSAPTIGETRSNVIENSSIKYTLMKAQIRVARGGSDVQGDDIIAVVIDSSPMTFAFGASPIGDSRSQAEVEKAILGLRVVTGQAT